jgi:hypothetical protein
VSLFYISEIDLASIPKAPPQEYIYIIISWMDDFLRYFLPENCKNNSGVRSPYENIMLYDLVWIIKKLKQRDYENDLYTITKNVFSMSEGEVKSLIVLEKLSDD